MEQRSYVVDEANDGVRIDKYLALLMEECSRSYIQKMIGDQLVCVNGKAVKANFKIHTGDAVMIELPDPVILDIQPENIPLDILYEDQDILIINKPKDMVVHPAPGHYTGTLVNAVMYHCGEDLSTINGVLRPGTVDAPIGRMDADRKKMGINHKNGRHAVTHYRVLERFGKYTYIECRLETGRTHQIRVHMASIGHPLLGDTVYGPSKDPFKLEGQALHAKLLGFIHPSTGQYVEFESPLPPYFTALLDRLRQSAGR